MTNEPENEIDDASEAPPGFNSSAFSSSEEASLSGQEFPDEKFGVIEAEIVEAETVEEPMIIDAVALPPSTFDHSEHGGASSKPAIVAGSPFAATNRETETRSRKLASPAESYAARGAATAALCLGVLSLVSSWFSGLALLPCLLGVVMGFWGATSAFRRRAILGLGMTLVAIAVTVTMSIIRPLIADSHANPTTRGNIVADAHPFSLSTVKSNLVRPSQHMT
jgi:hypothetical protein